MTPSHNESYPRGMPHVAVVEQDGAAIQERREQLGLSRTELAARIGPNRHAQSIANVERGRRVGKVFFHQIARALDADPEDLRKQRAEGDAA